MRFSYKKVGSDSLAASRWAPQSLFSVILGLTLCGFFARMSALMSWLQFMGPSSPDPFSETLRPTLCGFNAKL